MDLKNLNSFKNFIKSDVPKKNILFGAGQLGKLALYSLKQKKLNIDYFCDNDITKQGKKFHGIEVISFEDLNRIKSKKNVFISNIYVEEILSQLSKINDKVIFDCVDLFQETDFKNFDTNEEKNHDPAFNHKTIDVKRVVNGYERKIETAINYSEEKLILSHIDISITEKCSMKCKDCANLMQYYPNAKNSDTDQLIESLKKLLNTIHHVNEVRVLGGEPFMNKDFHKIVKFVCELDNIGSVIIYSNATIAPKKENLECLKHDKVKVDITNYGELSKNHENMINSFKDNSIPFTTQRAKYWTDSGTIEFKNRKDSDNVNVFKNCCVNDTYTLLNNKLYGCPFAAHAHNLNLIPKTSEDVINLDDKDVSDKKIKTELNKFLNRKREKKFLSACNYCAGRDNTVKKIPAAIQAKTHKTFNLNQDLKEE
jgi:MoaA/NifB/PqqE/SkfB family radical SAM enzyme